METKAGLLGGGGKIWLQLWETVIGNCCKMHHQYYQYIGSKKVKKTWWRRLLVAWVLSSTLASLWIFHYMSSQATEKRKEALGSMCDERARMLQDQFNVSMNHIQAMSILISTFHHGKNPSAIDQVQIYFLISLHLSFPKHRGRVREERFKDVLLIIVSI